MNILSSMSKFKVGLCVAIIVVGATAILWVITWAFIAAAQPREAPASARAILSTGTLGFGAGLAVMFGAMAWLATIALHRPNLPSSLPYLDDQRADVTTMCPPIAVVVDDEAPIRMIARRVLEQENWKVYEAASGPEALDVLGDHERLDLLVTDVHMPDMSGLRLASLVRKQRPDVKVLYVTGYRDRVFAAQTELPQDEGFLEKPFSRNALAEAASLLVFGTTVPGTPDPRR